MVHPIASIAPGKPVAARLLQVVAGLLCVMAGALAVDAADLRADTGLPAGAHDFIAYWSAFDVAANGGDPYAAPELREVQIGLHPRYEDGNPQRFWNPPWALVLMAPVLAFSFEYATALWLVVSVAAAAICAVVAWRLFVRTDAAIPPVVLCAALLFVPLIECLLLGQMSAVIAAFLLTGLLALRERWDLSAGALFALTAVKPQAVALVLVAVAAHVVFERRWKVVWGAFATISVCVISSLAAFPSVWAGWSPLGGSPTSAASATVAGWVRHLWPSEGVGPAWPLLVIPLFAAAAATWWVRSRNGRLDWSRVSGLLALSLLAAPYAAVYDAVVLIPVPVIIAAAAVRGARGGRAAVAALVGLQLLLLWYRSLEVTEHHHLIAVPLVLFALCAMLPRRWSYRSESGDTVSAGPMPPAGAGGG